METQFVKGPIPGWSVREESCGLFRQVAKAGKNQEGPSTGAVLHGTRPSCCLFMELLKSKWIGCGVCVSPAFSETNIAGWRQGSPADTGRP